MAADLKKQIKSLETLIRHHKWLLEERRRALNELLTERDLVQGHIDRTDAKIASEREFLRLQLGRADYHHSAELYAGFADDARAFRAGQVVRLGEVNRRIDAAQDTVTEAYRELKKYQIAQDTARASAKSEFDRREQIRLDDMAIDGFRLRQDSESRGDDFTSFDRA
ncbi:MAG: flagellar FliJ family protein [Candidatus Symbiobacter sp.]|nr:flagellar FliJ family protein [Candidatus Symbiobacter sp.]